jgi:hypothetical protein
VTGNGLYRVSLNTGASGATNGADPFTSAQKLPLMEGASLVVIGTGPYTVALYDTGLAGKTFYGDVGLTYSLKRPGTAEYSAGTIDTIGADGQVGYSRLPLFGLAFKTTTLNGTLLAGPGSATGDSDWNGSAGAPLPQLWDNSHHEFTFSSLANNTGNLVLTHHGLIKSNEHTTETEALADCLTPVANIVGLY